jgi:DNA-binding CsgD family transcriptional regulator/N-acetylneuraminic acid mutarotase
MPNIQSNELSERELDILKLVATGASNKEIAQKLFISSNTVKVHLRNIFTKIGAASRTEAAMYAVNIGLVKTVSSLLSPQGDEASLLNGSGDIGDHQKSSSDQFINRNFLRYFIPTAVVVILVILLAIYIRSDINSANARLIPTPTARIQWFSSHGLIDPRRGFALANYENQLYAIGGENAKGIINSVEGYNPKSDTWIKLAGKPTPTTDINAAVIGGLIYVPGGRLPSGALTNITEIYDPRTNKWSKGIPLPKPLNAYALTVFEGRMYLFGGWDGAKVVNAAYVFDERIGNWTTLPSMPTSRAYAGAAEVGGKIYVVGGWDGQKALAINEEFQPEPANNESQWSQAVPMPSGRYGMGIANLADIIFIIGGEGTEPNLAVIALSPDEKNWGQIEAPIKPDWTFLNSSTIGTRLYAIGGINGDSYADQTWSYQAIFTISLPIIR